ncbi:MAG: hypothetical protein ABJD07_01310 [Gemmatimonadaceae bacterium]
MQVFLHTRDRRTGEWHATLRELPLLPRVGDHLATASLPDEWLEIRLVVHTPDASDSLAELYAIPVERRAARQAAIT